MVIGGLQKFSLLDYPEHLSAIIFTTGCNFKCHYCYNPMLVCDISSASAGEESEKDHQPISEDDLFRFLQDRVGKLDAVVITGGEPTIQPDIIEFAEKIKKLGYKIKLDTNGSNPDVLNDLIEDKLVDYLAMDIKAAPEKYDLVTSAQPNLDNIKRSIDTIIKSGLPYEFRTTVVPKLVMPEDISAMGEMIKGAKKWYLQTFNPKSNLVNKEYQVVKPYSSADMEAMRQTASAYVEECAVR